MNVREQDINVQKAVIGLSASRRRKAQAQLTREKEGEGMLKRMLMMSLVAMMLAGTTMAYAADVYVTKHGKKYHKADCPLIRNKDVTEMTEKKAKKEGFEPCAKCMKKKAVKTEKPKKAKKVKKAKSKK